MKKLMALLSLCILPINGCACTINGEYEFEYLTLTVGDETKRYTCSDLDEQNPIVSPHCLIYDDMELLLTKDGKFIKEYDDSIVEETYYKIEDGKLFLSSSGKKDSDNYIERGTYKNGKITLNFDNLKVVFEK